MFNANPAAVHRYRAATAKITPDPVRKMCSRCRMPRPQSGGKLVAQAHTRRKEWVCAICSGASK